MNDVENDFRPGYVHAADLTCGSCDGSGQVVQVACSPCDGKGTRHVGCGAAVERDEAHPTLAYCQGCGRFVSTREVSEA